MNKLCKKINLVEQVLKSQSKLKTTFTKKLNNKNLSMKFFVKLFKHIQFILPKKFSEESGQQKLILCKW